MADMIGGFFEWEVPDAGPLPWEEGSHCALLHSGRAALEVLLRGLRDSGWAGDTVLLPRWTCDTVLQPLHRLRLNSRRYRISPDTLEPHLEDLEPSDALLLLTDYFGLCSDTVRRWAKLWPGPVVIDASMALFADYGDCPSFSSFRKWAGVPDGGIAKAPFPLPLPSSEARSAARMRCLLERLENGAEAALPFSEQAEAELQDNAKRMSPLTRRLLRSVRWEEMRRRRRENFAQLHEALAALNRLHLTPSADAVPFCYPLLCGIPGLRDELIDAGIALPLFWPEVIEACPAERAENYLSRSLLPLPLDQRYGPREMQHIIRLIRG